MNLPEFDIGPGRWFGPQGVATPQTGAPQTNPVQSQVPLPHNGQGLARLFQMWGHLQQNGGRHGNVGMQNGLVEQPGDRERVLGMFGDADPTGRLSELLRMLAARQ